MKQLKSAGRFEILDLPRHIGLADPQFPGRPGHGALCHRRAEGFEGFQVEEFIIHT